MSHSYIFYKEYNTRKYFLYLGKKAFCFSHPVVFELS